MNDISRVRARALRNFLSYGNRARDIFINGKKISCRCQEWNGMEQKENMLAIRRLSTIESRHRVSRRTFPRDIRFFSMNEAAARGIARKTRGKSYRVAYLACARARARRGKRKARGFFKGRFCLRLSLPDDLPWG